MRFNVMQDAYSGMWSVVDNMINTVVDLYYWPADAKQVAKKLNKLDADNNKRGGE
jgi:high-affinity Fe2+/Pb2+ permease